jgi:hypothetical protein
VPTRAWDAAERGGQVKGDSWGDALARVCWWVSADGEVGRTRTSQPLMGRLQIGRGQHYFCYHAQLASLSKNLEQERLFLRSAPGHGLIRGPLVKGGGLCLNLLRIIVVGWSGRWPTAG